MRTDEISGEFDGPINGRNFLACVEQILLPTLSPGDVVVMDNLGSQATWRRVGDRLDRCSPKECANCASA